MYQDQIYKRVNMYEVFMISVKVCNADKLHSLIAAHYEVFLWLVQRFVPLKNYILWLQLTTVPRFSEVLLWTHSTGCNPVFDMNAPIIRMVYIPHGNLNGESGLFLTHVNTMGGRPYWPSRMEASYCTFEFGAICEHYRYRGITPELNWNQLYAICHCG